MTWVAIGIAGVGVVTTAYSSNKAAGAASDAVDKSNDAAFESELQAARERSRILVEAEWKRDSILGQVDKIAGAAWMHRSRQTAALATRGVVLGNGSARSLTENTMRLAELDMAAKREDSVKVMLQAEYQMGDNETAAATRARNYTDSQYVASDLVRAKAGGAVVDSVLSLAATGASAGIEAYKNSGTGDYTGLTAGEAKPTYQQNVGPNEDIA